MTEVAEKLREARVLIEQRGWGQGYYENAEGCLCIYGAINLAVTGDPENDYAPSLEEPTRFLSLATGRGPDKLHKWNDAKCRTQAEVIAAFDRAIELAEQSA